uniref:Uncharacterized protein n=1 Tax=Picea sitchensis TaxID=3332 RepID=A9NKW7_PICSI|nr:unknown [Picea sitchensis]
MPRGSTPALQIRWRCFDPKKRQPPRRRRGGQVGCLCLRRSRRWRTASSGPPEGSVSPRPTSCLWAVSP